jgi:hypothetical protein
MLSTSPFSFGNAKILPKQKPFENQWFSDGNRNYQLAYWKYLAQSGVPFVPIIPTAGAIKKAPGDFARGFWYKAELSQSNA